MRLVPANGATMTSASNKTGIIAVSPAHKSVTGAMTRDLVTAEQEKDGVMEICSVPVIAAPMAGGPSTPRLVVEAARAGSVGFLPAGYRTVEQLAADMAAVRTSTEVFGVNLFVPERAAVDRGRVLAYRELIAPVAERVG